MYYRRTSQRSPWAIVPMAIIFLVVGIISFANYASTQADIQQKQQQLDNGVVTCGGQQMQSGDTCEKYWSVGTSTANNPGLDEGGNSYDSQQTENQQAIDKEKSSSSTGLWVGLLFVGLGLLSFFVFMRDIKKQI